MDWGPSHPGEGTEYVLALNGVPVWWINHCQPTAEVQLLTPSRACDRTLVLNSFAHTVALRFRNSSGEYNILSTLPFTVR